MPPLSHILKYEVQRHCYCEIGGDENTAKIDVVQIYQTLERMKNEKGFREALMLSIFEVDEDAGGTLEMDEFMGLISKIREIQEARALQKKTMQTILGKLRSGRRPFQYPIPPFTHAEPCARQGHAHRPRTCFLFLYVYPCSQIFAYVHK